MKRPIILLLLFGTMLVSACKKEDELTKPTQIGANTFSCRINRETFIAKQALFSPKSTYVAVYHGADPYFILQGRNFSTQPYREIEIKLFGNVTLGTYKLGGNSLNIGSISYRYPDNIYRTNTAHSGELTFTRVDHVNGIYAGTFYFSCIDANNQQLRITNGRFDVKIQ